jgi:hypothetical protein
LRVGDETDAAGIAFGARIVEWGCHVGRSAFRGSSSLEEPPAGVWAASWRGREGVRRLAPFRGDERNRPNRGYARPGRTTVRIHRSANHRSSMVVSRPASRKESRTGRRSKLTRAASSGTLSRR